MKQVVRSANNELASLKRQFDQAVTAKGPEAFSSLDLIASLRTDINDLGLISSRSPSFRLRISRAFKRLRSLKLALAHDPDHGVKPPLLFPTMSVVLVKGDAKDDAINDGTEQLSISMKHDGDNYDLTLTGTIAPGICNILNRAGFGRVEAPSNQLCKTSVEFRAASCTRSRLAIAVVEDIIYKHHRLRNRKGLTSNRPVSRRLYNWQKNALGAWNENEHRGIITAVTGSGKTDIALDAIRAQLMAARSRVVIIVPTVALMEQWLVRLNSEYGQANVAACGGSHDGSISASRICVYVGASAKLRLTGQLDQLPANERLLLVADECHRYGAEGYLQSGVLSERFQQRLGLSATPNRRNDFAYETELVPYFKGQVFRYGYRQALSDQTISDVQVALIRVEFTVHERREYDSYTEQLRVVKRKLLAAYPKTCHSGKAFFNIVSRLAEKEKASDLPLGRPASTYLMLVHQRQDVLMEAEARTQILSNESILWAIARMKTIIFHKRIDQCDRIASHLRSITTAVVHHSGIASEDRNRALDQFGSDDARCIVTAETLSEGIDVPDAELAIIMAGIREKRSVIQKAGRVLRLSKHKRVAKIMLVYVGGTVEESCAGPEEETVTDDLSLTGEMRLLGKVTEFRLPADAKHIGAWLAN